MLGCLTLFVVASNSVRYIFSDLCPAFLVFMRGYVLSQSFPTLTHLSLEQRLVDAYVSLQKLSRGTLNLFVKRFSKSSAIGYGVCQGSCRVELQIS